jgi:hypothetical protein
MVGIEIFDSLVRIKVGDGKSVLFYCSGDDFAPGLILTICKCTINVRTIVIHVLVDN